MYRTPIQIRLIGGLLRFKLVKALILAALAGSLATATDFSFSGSLAADDSIQLFRFTLAATDTLTLRTYSYAGGVNQAGNIISGGGFDPILSLFDSAGALINENDDGHSHVPADPVTGQQWDSYLTTTLAAGTYTVSLTQYDNFPNGPNLSNGFIRTGDPNFTSEFGCTNGRFCDLTSDNRTPNWAFDVLGANSAVIVNTAPEPGVPALTGVGMLLIIVFRRGKCWKTCFRQ